MYIGSFELLYKENQRPRLGDGFTPYDISKVNRPDFREIGGFLSFVRSGVWSKYDSCGLFSPKFFEKIGIDDAAYRSFIAEYAEADVFLFHPFPRETLIANHFLELAELEHPGISLALSKVWRIVFGRDLQEINLLKHRVFACHCNYFSATPAFWADYGIYIRRFAELLSSEEGGFLRQQTPYTLTQTPDRKLPLAPFVFERALSHFLFDNRRRYKVANFALSRPLWSPVQVFEGEGEVVTDLLSAISRAPLGSERTARSLAVNAYYLRRKLGVLKNE